MLTKELSLDWYISLKWLPTVIIMELIIWLHQQKDPCVDFQQMHVIIIIAYQQIYLGLNDSSACHLEELVCSGIAFVCLL